MTDILKKRGAGILLHPTSLPGPYGIGEMGEFAYGFLEFLSRAGQSFWQTLPLGPTSYGDSPYQCFSASAGNPLLISLRRLVEEGLLEEKDLASDPGVEAAVDYGTVIPWKTTVLRRAFERWRGRGGAESEEFLRFRSEQGEWLSEYALFMAIKDSQEGRSWVEWPEEYRKREPAALEAARSELETGILFHEFLQHLFFRQWSDLRRAANERGIRIIGDAPIFVALDSADVWSRQDLFYLDDEGRPTVVAGVPPDYFSETGQRWGNPLYRWDRLAAEGFRWWKRRIEVLLKMVDVIRIDHFRGFEAYWEIPATEPTAVKGNWVKVPGETLFASLRELGEVPVIAENLGVITEEVEQLRRRAGFPGMSVLQFAFEGRDPENPFLPHNCDPETVVYTGTHDNDTTRGWFSGLSAEDREWFWRYSGAAAGEEPEWEMIRLAQGSVARQAIIPMQDYLGLGSEARMNYPGRKGGNWTWRCRAGAFSEALADRIREITHRYGRLNG
ncbi:MAG: 4-alpha-glucanotransferase [Candidatus Hydrogenedentota bacterium]|nr:MAG: 4-alpha-glucanotransferase [Candidatus Hydrogenedentota bacterium]